MQHAEPNKYILWKGAARCTLEFGALKPPLAGLAAAEIGYVPLERVEKA